MIRLMLPGFLDRAPCKHQKNNRLTYFAHFFPVKECENRKIPPTIKDHATQPTSSRSYRALLVIVCDAS